MLICHNVSNLHPSTDSQDDITFSTPSQAYTNLFIFYLFILQILKRCQHLFQDTVNQLHSNLS